MFEEFEYSTYGEIISTSTFEHFPFRYRGYYYDSDLGMYNLGTRYYDPEVGRFLTVDAFVSTGQGVLGHNMYAYCGNNPIINIDPSGYFFENFINAIKNLFNASVNTGVNYTSQKTGDYSTAYQIGEKLKIGDKKTTKTAQAVVDSVSEHEVTVGASIGIGIKNSPLNVEAGIGSSVSLNNGRKDYLYVGAGFDSDCSISITSPANLSFDFNMQKMELDPYINSGFSTVAEFKKFAESKNTGFNISTEMGPSFGVNYHWVFDRY